MVSDLNDVQVKVLKSFGMNKAFLACSTIICYFISAVDLRTLNTDFPVSARTLSYTGDSTYDLGIFLTASSQNKGILVAESDPNILDTYITTQIMNIETPVASTVSEAMTALDSTDTYVVTGLKNTLRLLVKHCCTPNCLFCNSTASNGCLRCSNGYQLSKGTCVLVSCDPNCLSCYGPTSHECLSCNPMWYLDLVTTTCNYSCDPQCMTCNGPFDNNCLSCNTTINVLNNGQCYECANSFDLNKDICTTGDSQVRFVDWNATLDEYYFGGEKDPLNNVLRAVEIQINLLNISTIKVIPSAQILDLFSFQSNVSISNIYTSDSKAIISFKALLVAGESVTIQVKNKWSLIGVNAGREVRLTNRNYTLGQSIPLPAIDSSKFAETTAAILRPLKAAFMAAGFVTYSFSCCSSNVGGSFVQLFQVIEVFGKFYFIPTAFSEVLNFCLNKINDLGMFLQLDRNSIMKRPRDARNPYYYKLTLSKEDPLILRSYPMYSFIFGVDFSVKDRDLHSFCSWQKLHFHAME
jgi:hypothetical protein